MIVIKKITDISAMEKILTISSTTRGSYPDNISIYRQQLQSYIASQNTPGIINNATLIIPSVSNTISKRKESNHALSSKRQKSNNLEHLVKECDSSVLSNSDIHRSSVITQLIEDASQVIDNSSLDNPSDNCRVELQDNIFTQWPTVESIQFQGISLLLRCGFSRSANSQNLKNINKLGKKIQKLYQKKNRKIISKLVLKVNPRNSKVNSY
jgi:hypothetical protein